MKTLKFILHNILFTFIIAVGAFTNAQGQTYNFSASKVPHSGTPMIEIRGTEIPIQANRWILYRDGVEIVNRQVSGFGIFVYQDYNIQDGRIYDYCLEWQLTNGTVLNKMCDEGISYTNKDLLSVSDAVSDAYLFLDFAIPYPCFLIDNKLGTSYYLQIRDLATNKDVFTKEIDEPTRQAFYEGRVRILKDAGISGARYRLNVYKIGPGQSLCDFTETGSTLPYQPISDTTGRTTAYSVELSWKHNTDHDSLIRLFRNGRLLALLPHGTSSYTDRYSESDTGSIQNAPDKTYTYEIQAIDPRFTPTKVYPLERVGSPNLKLKQVDLKCTYLDPAYTDKVQLSWNNVAAYCEGIQIFRDGQLYAKLPNTSTAYTDKWPVFGKEHLYQVRLVGENEELLIQVAEKGMVAPIGYLDGWVQSNDGHKIGFPDVTLELIYIYEKDTVIRRTTTDASGYYQFKDVYFGPNGDLQIQYVRGSQPLSFVASSYALKFSKSKPALRQNFLAYSDVLLSDEDLIEVSGLTLTPRPNRNGVRISFQYKEQLEAYTQGIYHIYRDGRIISSGTLNSSATSRSFAYEDHMGTPGKDPTEYRVMFYILDGTTLHRHFLARTVAYPAVRKAATFSAQANTDASVKLSWTTNASHFTGYRLLRLEQGQTLAQGTQIWEGDSDQVEYVDRHGRNGAAYHYVLQSYIDRNDRTYVSDTMQLVRNFPTLVAPSNLSISANSKENSVTLSWTFSRDLNYIYDGFLISRDGVPVDSVWKSTGVLNGSIYEFQYTDRSGTPGTHTWRVMTWKSNLRSLSAALVRTDVYPAVNPPTSIRVEVLKNGSDPLGLVRILIEDETENITGKRLQLSGSDVLFLDPGVREFIFIPTRNILPFEQFQIANYVDVRGVRYYSSNVASNQLGEWVRIAGTMTEVPENFKASDSLIRHVRLSWEFPSYILAEFQIFRNGIQIGTADPYDRVYFDNDPDVRPGIPYTYQIKARVQRMESGTLVWKESTLVGDYGMRRSSGVIKGTVTSKNGGIGIGEAMIFITGSYSVGNQNTEYERVLITDPTGFFMFTELDNVNMNTLKVRVEKQNYTFEKEEETIELISGEDPDDVHFIATNDLNYPHREDGVSELSGLNATYNRDLHQVEVRWSTDGPQYDGFEVYRGLGIVEEILADQPKVYYHVDGAPGFYYNYAVRAYKDYPEGRVYSKILSGSAVFPQVEPPSHVSAQPNARKDEVRVTWSHPTNNCTFYEISRDGVKLEQQDAILGNFEYLDTSGYPDRTHKYSVVAVKVVENREFRSQPVEVTSAFPEVALPSGLVLSNIPNGIRIQWTGNGHPRGYRILRDESILADIPYNASTAYSYEDFSGTPGNRHRYAVYAYDIREVSGMELVSRSIQDTLTHSKLQSVSNLSNTPGIDETTVRWKYNKAFQGVDHFKVQRFVYLNAGTLLPIHMETFLVGREKVEGDYPDDFSLLDEDGYDFELTPYIQGAFYRYLVFAGSSRNGTIYYSNEAYAGVNPNRIEAPSNLRAELVPNSAAVKLTWDHRSPYNEEFVLYRGADSIAVIPGGKRSYVVMLNDVTTGTKLQFKLRSARNHPFRYIYSPRRRYSGEAVSNEVTYLNGSFPIEMPNPPSGKTFRWKSVALNGTDMAAGSDFGSSGDSKGYVWTWRDGSWKFSQNLVESGSNANYNAIDMDDGQMIVGHHLYVKDSESAGLVSWYRKENGTWVKRESATTWNDGAIETRHMYGHSVSISGRRSLIGAPENDHRPSSGDKYNDVGMVQAFTYTNGIWGKHDPQSISYGSSISRYLGNSVALDGNNGVASWLWISGPIYIGTFIHFFDLSDFGKLKDGSPNYIVLQDDDYNLKGAYRRFESPGPIEELIVDVSGNWAVFGAHHSTEKGKTDLIGAAVFFKKSNTGTWTTHQTVVANDANNHRYFGRVVNFDGSSCFIMSSNRIHHWVRGNDDVWRHSRVFDTPVGLDDATIAVAEFDDGRAVIGHGSNLEVINTIPPIDKLTATDGTSGSVTLRWEYSSLLPSRGFIVYRDGQEIKQESSGSVRSYTDSEALPGVEYVYSVVNVGPNDRISPFVSDLGSAKTEGRIFGTVRTKHEIANGVSGVLVRASAQIGNEFYRSSTTTDDEGKYSIDGLKYAEEGTTYTVQVSYPDHVFEQAVKTARLNADTKVVSLDFTDNTAYSIAGYVYSSGMCGLDSAEVVLHQYWQTRDRKDTVFTNKAGLYNFSFNPTDPALRRVEVEVLNTRYYPPRGTSAPRRIPMYNMQVSNGANRIIESFGNLKEVTTINFTDQTAYTVDVHVTTVCGPIPGVDSMRIEVSSGSCYRKILTTDRNGDVQIGGLAPLHYGFKVIAIWPNSINNERIIKYLNARPSSLDLLSVHRKRQIDQFNDPNGTPAPWTNPQIEILYHKIPVISLSGFKQYQCNDPARAVLWQQGELASFDVKVTEYHGRSCEVHSGYLVVRNEAATEKLMYLGYDEVNQKWRRLLKQPTEASEVTDFRDFEFEVSTPNAVAPHIWYILVEYHTFEGGYLAETSKAVIVEGNVPTPGNDIIVDPSEEGAIPIPLYVLRDPPGDASYTFLKTGRTFRRSFQNSLEKGGQGSLGLTIDNNALGLGLKIEPKVTIGGEKSDQKVHEFEVTVQEEISTDQGSSSFNAKSDGWLMGQSADIVVGMGLAQQYGSSHRVSIDPNSENCEPIVTQVLSFGMGTISTQWIYTVDQIRNLKELYESYAQRALSQEPDFVLEGYSPVESAAYFNAIAGNWAGILRYHEVETNPKYYLCTAGEDLFDGWGKLSDNQRNKINDRLEKFCTAIGEYNTVNGERQFDPFEDKIWDQGIIDQYNQLSIALRNKEKYLSYEDKFNRDKQLTISQEDLKIYGKDATNTTFSGGTSYSREITTKRAHTTTMSSNFFVNPSLGITKGFESESELVKNVSFGSPTNHVIIGLNQTLSKTEYEVQVAVESKITFKEENNTLVDSSTTTGYVLSDDDPGDQFSVTVIRGIDPAYSPYFELVGGRSSCPTEEGAIPRDLFQVDFRTAPPNETIVNTHQRYLQADSTARFGIKITNRNEFLEPRFYDVYVPWGKNNSNATVRVGGQVLGNGSRTFLIAPNESVYLDVEVTRARGVYQHLDLGIGVQAQCDLFNSQEFDLKAEWIGPCSPVSILSEDNWIVNRNPDGSVDPLRIRLGDFELYNNKMDSIAVMYRRVSGTDSIRGWQTLRSIPRDSLIYFDTSGRSELISPPEYVFDWDVEEAGIVDGRYELRAQAYCNVYGYTTSNSIFGTIDRKSVQLWGVPEPSDGVLSRGDVVLVRFNEDLDDGRQSEAQFRFYISDNPGDTIELPALATFNGDLVIFDLGNLNIYDRKLIRARLDRVYDVNGNRNSTPVVWSFRVNNSAFSWIPEQVSERMVVNTQKEIPLFISNSFTIEENFTISKALGSTWLDVSQNSGTIPIGGLSMKLLFNANGLRLDSVYRDTLILRVSEIGEFTFRYLPVELRVFSTPPAWKPIEGATQYQESFVLQYRFKGNPTSKDELDRIALLIEEQVVGVGNILKVSSATSEDRYYAFITIKGGESHLNKPIECRVWNNELGKEFNAYPPFANRALFKFNGNFALKGTTRDPLILEIDPLKDEARYYPIRSGYSWFSIPTQMDTMTLPYVFKSLKQNSVYQAVTTYGGVQRNTTTGKWQHMNDSVIAINEDDRIDFVHLWSNSPDTLRVTGRVLNITNISVDTGWNEVGVPGDSVLAVTNLSYDADTIPNDQARIIGMDGGTIFDSTAGTWSNPAFPMIPGQGYMVNWGREDELILNKKSEDPDLWQVNRKKFQHQMIFVAMIRINGVMSLNEYDRIGAFVDGECRGVANLVYYEDVNRYLVFLRVYSNTPGEVVTFKMLDWDQDLVFDAIQQFSFQPGGTLGYIWEPFIFSTGYLTGVPRKYEVEGACVVYPNPFSNELNIRIESSQNEQVEIQLYDQTGRKLFNQPQTIRKGEQTVTLQTLSENLPDGVYVLRIVGQATLREFKVVKVKH